MIWHLVVLALCSRFKNLEWPSNQEKRTKIDNCHNAILHSLETDCCPIAGGYWRKFSCPLCKRAPIRMRKFWIFTTTGLTVGVHSPLPRRRTCELVTQILRGWIIIQKIFTPNVSYQRSFQPKHIDIITYCYVIVGKPSKVFWWFFLERQVCQSQSPFERKDSAQIVLFSPLPLLLLCPPDVPMFQSKLKDSICPSKLWKFCLTCSTE